MFKIAFILIFFVNINIFCSSEYRWPLNIKNGFSSTFGEFRYTHLHGGLDLRTFQKNGFPVFAITDGEIYRIRAVFRGSGNGIYMKHTDGRVSLYYHLEDFGEVLKSVVTGARKKGKYFGNYDLKHPVKVKKGDVIGYTGETGAGFPHLHLELQDGKGRKLNPLNYLKSPMRDRYRPVIRDVRIKSRGDTLINGKIGEVQTFFRKRRKTGSSSPVVVTGSFDLSSTIYDVTDTKRKATPYKISAHYDGKLFYNIAFDNFVWKDHNQLGLLYDLKHSVPGVGTYKLSPFKSYTLAEIRDTSEFLSRDGNLHNIVISAEDKDGNTRDGRLAVYHMTKPEVKVGKLKNGILFFNSIKAPGCDTVQVKNLKKGKSRSFAVSWNNLEKWGSVKIQKNSEAVELLFRKKGVIYYRYPVIFNKIATPFLQENIRTFLNRNRVTVLFKNRELPLDGYHLEYTEKGKTIIVEPVSTLKGPAFVITPPDLNGEFRFTIVHDNNRELNSSHSVDLITLVPGKGKSFRKGEFSVNFGSTTVREGFVLKYGKQNYKSRYKCLSEQHYLGPETVPFLDKVYVRIRKQVDNPQQVGIFQYNYRYGKWFYTGSGYNSKSSTFSSKRRNGGLFALMRDDIPPQVGVYVETRRLSRLKAYYIKVTDKGKGVDHRSLKVTVNGKKIYCEYDPDRKYAVVKKISLLKPGKNRFLIEVKDRGGNRTSRSLTLKFRK